MKTNIKIILSGILSLTFLTNNLIANDNVDKGQKLYLKACKECHGNGVKGAAMHTQEEWKKLFLNNGKIIIEKHQKDEKAKKYFNGEAFKTHSPFLKDFLHEYGNDSGNVPACG